MSNDWWSYNGGAVFLIACFGWVVLGSIVDVSAIENAVMRSFVDACYARIGCR